jgi:hypothetical protein
MSENRINNIVRSVVNSITAAAGRRAEACRRIARPQGPIARSAQPTGLENLEARGYFSAVPLATPALHAINSPAESVLVSDLKASHKSTPATTATASVSGIVYEDGVKKQTNKGLAGITVTLQEIKRGKAVGRLQSTITSATGAYSFINLAAGHTYRIAEIHTGEDLITRPFALTSGDLASFRLGLYNDYTINVSTGEHVTGENFGNLDLPVAFGYDPTVAATPLQQAI